MTREPTDILKLCYDGQLTGEEAQTLFEKYTADFHRFIYITDPFYWAMMSPQETTAWCHGTPLEVLAKWRYEGWPKMCTVCGREIDYTEPGWFVTEDSDGRFGLTHVMGCLEELNAQRRISSQ